MTSIIYVLSRLVQLRHRTTRRRLVEKLARRFTSRRHALEISRHIP